MTGFPIIHPLINLEIKLEEVNKLYIHEEILQKPLQNLVKSLKSDKYFMHPIIVDSKSLVVLDGMHRVAAIQELGYHFIPVCLLDYENPHVKIGCWYRLINPKSELERITKVIEDIGFTLIDHDIDDAYKLIEKRKAVAAIAFKSKSYTIHKSLTNIKDVYNSIKKIESRLEFKGYRISYDTEKDARLKVASGEVFASIMVPTVTKEEVVQTALKEQVFNHKTTRHVIPARPLFLNIPLNWLYSKLTPKKINKKLVKYLSTKKYKRLPPGQILDRRYEEETYIFK